MTATIPVWAMTHLERHLPAGNPVVNAHAVRRNTVLANTRLGAVLVQRGLFSGVRHIFLEVPSQKTAFRCANCQENLQFYNLDIPNDVFCSICAAKYHVDAVGRVRDDEGKELAAEFKPKQLHPFPPVPAKWDAASHVRDADAPLARRSADDNGQSAFRHKGYTLYAREMATGTGKRTLFFFSKGTPKAGSPSPLPDGFAVGANSRTGLPFLRKSTQSEAAPVRAPPSARKKGGAGSKRKSRKAKPLRRGA